MESAIQDLVNMGDVESLYEVMTEHEDIVYCFDAAEGLITLGDKRGIEFLLEAIESDDEEIHEIAQEMLDSPEVRRKRQELEGPLAAEKKKEIQAALETARKRVAEGKKVFIYKTIFLPSSYFINTDEPEEDDNVDALNEFGFDGWEVAAFFPITNARLQGNSGISLSGKLTGGHFLIKKEVTADESDELDNL